MTFLSGLRLLLLVVPVALAVAYVLVARNRPRVAARFSSTDLLASVAPRRSGWQRHAPWIALLSALVVGVLAFAQPALAMYTPKERATVMLTLDTSASMQADDVAPSRLAAAQDAARAFITELPPGLQVGLVTFDYSAVLAQPPTTDRAALLRSIDTLKLGEGTNTGAGLETALTAIENVKPDADGNQAPAAVVLMSDGRPTVGTGLLGPEESVAQATDRAQQLGVPISTIAFGTDEGTVSISGERIPVPSDPETLAAIAQATGGEAFTAESAAELGSVYDAIGSAVGYDEELVDVSAWAAGLALLFAALAAVFALIWTQQLA